MIDNCNCWFFFLFIVLGMICFEIRFGCFVDLFIFYIMRMIFSNNVIFEFFIKINFFVFFYKFFIIRLW